MKFSTEQVVEGIDLDTYEKLFFDEALNIAICDDLAMERTLLQRDERGGVLHRRVRIHPRRKLPASLGRVVDPQRITYTETMTYAFGSREAHWEIVPGIFADKVSSRGCVRFLPHPAGCIRRVEGEVQVRIFGLGKVVERFIVDDIERSFARAAEFTSSWQQAHGVPEVARDDGDGDDDGDDRDARDTAVPADAAGRGLHGG